MTDRIVSVGDTVKVYDLYGSRIEDGKVMKVGRALVHVSHGQVSTFRLDTGLANDANPREGFRTLAQQAEWERGIAAREVLKAYDLFPCGLPLEVLEALAAVLTEHDAEGDA